MAGQKMKLGARVLSDQEIELILPNTATIWDQIRMFRGGHLLSTDDREQYEQKINNIGIMGKRGAGKTSILRTFYQRLEQENQKRQTKDIILPFIIPENMSQDAILMDVILGMLKPYVAAYGKKRSTESDCIRSGRSQLEKTYNDMVKQYCYIRKDYRNILIQQFTTEQYYVDKSTEIFNSDSEFIKQFQRFIDILLEGENAERKSSDAMLFLFIDDIDLSTTRCMDAVRTLLSYLSNQRIVTFISGDLTTFEEALTLEFIRQEKMDSADLLDKSYYGNSVLNKRDSLLERKKELSYEYLKKIIPPAYRHEIKYWSLSERKKYLVTDKNVNSFLSLSELLDRVTSERTGNIYFKPDVSYHMFDDTSRGLNNVYNILLQSFSYEHETENINKIPENNLKQNQYWRLIETIIDSKPLYVKYKDIIKQQIIIREKDLVRIDFSNARNFIYSGKKIADGSNETMSALPGEERYPLFLLIDFAARLFTIDIQSSSDYTGLKNKILEDFINMEEIEGKIASGTNRIDLMSLEEFRKENIASVWDILSGFLLKGDIIFDVYFCNYLGRKDIYNILIRKDTSSENYNRLAFALSETISCMADDEYTRKEYMASLFLDMQSEIELLLTNISGDTDIVWWMKFMNEQSCDDPFGFRFWKSKYSCTEGAFWSVENYIYEAESSSGDSKLDAICAVYAHKNSRYWIYEAYCLSENVKAYNSIQYKLKKMVSQAIAKALMNQLAPLFQHYFMPKTDERTYKSIMQEDSTKEIPVLYQIDKNDLWKKLFVKEKVGIALKNKVYDYISNINNGELIFDVSKIMCEQGSYRKLMKCSTGASGTALIINVRNRLKKFLEIFDCPFDDGNYYMSLIQILIVSYIVDEFISNHPRANYGYREIRQLSHDIEEMPLVLRYQPEEWNKLREELKKRENSFFEDRERSMLFNVWEISFLDDDDISTIYKQYYDQISKNKITLDDFTKHYMDQHGISFDSKNCSILKYLIQEKKIKDLIEKFNITEISFEEYAQILPKEESTFYMQCYLRYMQANQPEFEKGAIWAEAVSNLVSDLLDSEIIADHIMKNEVYEIINKELDLDEGEFERMF